MTRPYKVLVIGGGGREHALAWKCAQSPRVDEVLVAPGNAGTAREPKVRNVAIDASKLDELARSRRVNRSPHHVGPEVRCRGHHRRVRRARLACFGPSKAAARSKARRPLPRSFCTPSHPHGAVPQVHARISTPPGSRAPMPIVVKAAA